MQEDKERNLVDKLLNPKTQRTAFEELVKEYSQQLYWQIRKIVVAHHDANDVLQNVFIKAWTNIDSFRAESKLSTWLYRIAVNESITFLNKEKAKRGISIDDDNSFVITQLEGDPYFDNEAAEAKLHRAILSLPDKQRLVFNMRYFDEMKFSEISAILDTSEGALKASFHHAKNKIEEFLAKEN